MIKTLSLIARSGKATQKGIFPTLPEYCRGLPTVTDQQCETGCSTCIEECPAQAIKKTRSTNDEIVVSIDLGLCVACGKCESSCPTGTIAANRRTDIAVLSREGLISSNLKSEHKINQRNLGKRAYSQSLHVRVVSTGDSASDLEIAASENPIFDGARFGITTVASPRFADALLITGPVAHGMQEPLLRCYASMPSTRLVVAVGTSAISGGLYQGGYASANGVDSVLPVDAYVPGNPPHPWSILHGLMLVMQHKLVKP